MLNSLLRAIGIYRIYQRYLKSQISKGEKPQHVGIILDGNRRWAQQKSVSRWLGHFVGADTAEQLLEWCHELGIKTITIYALSTENLTRSSDEIVELMHLLEERLNKLLSDERIHRYRVKVKTIGKPELLPESIQNILRQVEEATKNYNDHFLNIALAYGGRAEILDAVKRLVQKTLSGELLPEAITQKTVEDHLYTSHLPNPEPDLVVRTSGEERLSGFLLWQAAYSELVFLDVYWPDFRKIDLMRAIRTYQRRVRRFGK